MPLVSTFRSLLRVLRDWRFLPREAKAGDVVHVPETWALLIEDEDFSLLNVWFPKFPRSGTARLVRETKQHWYLTFWCREIRLGKDRNTVRPLNRIGRWTAFDLPGQHWVARQLMAMRPPDDAPEPPPPPHPVPSLLRRLAIPRGGLETVHALGGRYRSWLGLLWRRWLHEKTRALLGVPSPGFYMRKGPLVEDCRVILTFTYRGETRRLRLDQVRRHENGNIHFLGRQLPKGDQRSFAFQNISNLTIEGFGRINDTRLFIELDALEASAYQHHLNWASTAQREGLPLPAPDLATRLVGKTWKQLTRPYRAYMYWRYPKNRLFRKLTFREKIAKRTKVLRDLLRVARAHLNWVRHEYGPQPAQRRDLTGPDARWRHLLREAAERLDASQGVDIHDLHHLTKLAKEPMLARKIARHILREERASLAKSDPDRDLITATLRLSPNRRRFIPDRETKRAKQVGNGMILQWNPFQKLYDIPRDPEPAMIVQAFLKALYRSDFWKKPDGFAPQHVQRGDFRVLLLLHLGRPDGRKWLFSELAAERMRKIASL